MHSRGRSGHLPPGRGRRGDTDTNAGFQNPAAGQFRGSLTYRPQQGPRFPAMERRQGGNIPPYQQQPLAPWQMQAAPQQVQTPQYFAYSNREQVDPYRNLAHPLPPGLANPAAIVQMNSRHQHPATEDQNFGPLATYNHRYPTTNVGHNQMSTMQRQTPGGSINSYESRNHMVERQAPSQATQSYSHYINPANYFGQQYAGYPEHPGYFTNEYTARFPNAYSGTSADSTPYQRNPPAPGPFGDASYYQQVVGQPSHNTPPQVPALPVSVASPQQPPRQLGFAGAPPTKQSNGITPQLVDLADEDNGSIGEDVDKEDNRSKERDVDNDREREEHGAEKRNDESNANGKSTDGSTESFSYCSDEGTSESSSDSTYMVRKNETILEILREGLKRNLSEDTAADQQLIKCFRVCEHVYSSSSDPELENEYDENLRKKLKSCSHYEVGGVLIEVPEWRSSHATSDQDADGSITQKNIKPADERETAIPQATDNSRSNDSAKKSIQVEEEDYSEAMQGIFKTPVQRSPGRRSSGRVMTGSIVRENIKPADEAETTTPQATTNSRPKDSAKKSIQVEEEDYSDAMQNLMKTPAQNSINMMNETATPQSSKKIPKSATKFQISTSEKSKAKAVPSRQSRRSLARNSCAVVDHSTLSTMESEDARSSEAPNEDPIVQHVEIPVVQVSTPRRGRPKKVEAAEPVALSDKTIQQHESKNESKSVQDDVTVSKRNGRGKATVVEPGTSSSATAITQDQINTTNNESNVEVVPIVAGRATRRKRGADADDVPTAPVSEKKPTQRRKRQNVDPVEEQESMNNDEAVAVEPIKRPRKGRANAAVTDVIVENNNEVEQNHIDSTNAEPTPKRRGRKKATAKADTPVVVQEPTPRRGRPKKAAKSVPVPVSHRSTRNQHIEDNSVSLEAVETVSKRRGRGKATVVEPSTSSLATAITHDQINTTNNESNVEDVPTVTGRATKRKRAADADDVPTAPVSEKAPTKRRKRQNDTPSEGQELTVESKNISGIPQKSAKLQRGKTIDKDVQTEDNMEVEEPKRTTRAKRGAKDTSKTADNTEVEEPKRTARAKRGAEDKSKSGPTRVMRCRKKIWCW